MLEGLAKRNPESERKTRKFVWLWSHPGVSLKVPMACAMLEGLARGNPEFDRKTRKFVFS